MKTEIWAVLITAVTTIIIKLMDIVVVMLKSRIDSQPSKNSKDPAIAAVEITEQTRVKTGNSISMLLVFDLVVLVLVAGFAWASFSSRAPLTEGRAALFMALGSLWIVSASRRSN